MTLTGDKKASWSKTFQRLILLGVILSLVGLLVEFYFSKHILHLVPNDQFAAELYGYADPNSGLSASWQDPSSNAMICHFKKTDPYGCGWSLKLGSAPFDRLDLQKYQTLNVSLKYSGPATRVRVFFRNYNPAYTNEHDPSSTKVMQTTLSVNELEEQAQIPFSSLSVASWWLLENVDRYAWPKPEFNAITYIGFDFIERGEHHLAVESAYIEGKWISTKTVLSIVLGYWMSLFVLDGLVRWSRTYTKANRESKMLNQLESETKRLQDENHFLSKEIELDPLTGALSKKGFDSKVEEIAERSGDMQNWTLIVIDLDHFRNINEKIGHDGGDKILKAFTGIVFAILPTESIFARIAGDEFTILFPNKSAKTTANFSKRLLQAINNICYDIDENHFLQASIGVAIGQQGEFFENLIRRAERALAQAKKTGLNRVELTFDADVGGHNDS